MIAKSAGNSVVFLGDDIYYWGHDGFYHFNRGQSNPIGAEQVDKFIADDLDTTNMDAFRGAIDRQNRLVLWSYPSLSKGKNQIIVYTYLIFIL